MQIKVVNGKIDGFIGKDKIYIGRSNPHFGLKRSVLANPYSIGFDGDRNQVIELYRRWLRHRIFDSEVKGKATVETVEIYSIAKRHMSGEDIKLTCYCKPLPCHGDIIVRCVEWMIREYLA